ncbi:N-acetyltransferase [Halobiforma lacisalsi AJ5]|uniref:Acetyltransferase including N-acetylase of ribosomal protein-like protein n=1 Tax=Natronobacterium lacisalsi AJ5 TaxID=358396 RepID=M0LRP4_NATLA|nr:GNAT family protein [Halobiforma lacisalsi]APW96826.1 N-acetyltransferase [Halobiforma lacisalsi AJ5]EMA35099.1 Acetyltransferase including N-acetylase of ribosomal protein-like protein [Halobiforma lacisalsi AJ5]
MTHDLFPERIETNRLKFERLSHENVDSFEFYEFVTHDAWQGDATEHMPWFRFRRLDQVITFIDRAEEKWADHGSARYLLRSKEEDNEIVGTTAYGPDWEERRASSDIVLSKRYWGREYGLERASAFIELTFEKYDLDAYYTTCAANNEPSRRMIEKYIEKYGGCHEGLLRQHSSRPDGKVTDQHRFTILRSEYEEAIQGKDTLDFEIDW